MSTDVVDDATAMRFIREALDAGLDVDADRAAWQAWVAARASGRTAVCVGRPPDPARWHRLPETTGHATAARWVEAGLATPWQGTDPPTWLLTPPIAPGDTPTLGHIVAAGNALGARPPT